jgi:hypothetical protein
MRRMKELYSIIFKRLLTVQIQYILKLQEHLQQSSCKRRGSASPSEQLNSGNKNPWHLPDMMHVSNTNVWHCQSNPIGAMLRQLLMETEDPTLKEQPPPLYPTEMSSVVFGGSLTYTRWHEAIYLPSMPSPQHRAGLELKHLSRYCPHLVATGTITPKHGTIPVPWNI